MKWMAVLLGFFFFSPVFALRVFAMGGSVVIINQVRGNECCDEGSVVALEQQMETLAAHKLPAAFAFRYDALKEPRITDLFSKQDKEDIEVGAFLEVTPSLAHDAGVTYKGPPERWYKSENAYLLGYDPDTRQKIIDTYMRVFHSVFGRYPQTTVAWMIDAPSLRYVSKKYGVLFHELTREQWGTDSYTLYGGPVGYPYIPSKHWPLIPALEKNDSVPIIIGRQTIVDPVRSYGDGQSVFTSQPNDYMKGGLQLSYFQKLVEQSLAQHPEGFALVGLETSMGKKAQDEYIEQLIYLDHVRTKNPGVKVQLPSEYAKQRLQVGVMNSVSIYDGTDDNASAVWVTTSRYRTRLVVNKETRDVTIDDVHIYDDRFEDPYTHATPTTPNAYWITPFVIDGSRYFQKKSASMWEPWITWGTKVLRRFDPCKEMPSIASDVCTIPDGIKLPVIAQASSLVVHDGSVEYQTADGQVKLDFATDKIHINSEHVSFSPATTMMRSMNASTLYGLGYVWEKGGVTIVPWVSPGATLSQITAENPPAYVPETAGGEVSLTHSLLIPASTTVQLGRNPVRIVLYMRDDQGRVATSGAIPSLILRGDPEAKVEIHHPETSLAEYYLDATPTKVGTVIPIVTLGTEVKAVSHIAVVPNCLRSFTCFSHPRMLFLWLKMNVKERLHIRS